MGNESPLNRSTLSAQIAHQLIEVLEGDDYEPGDEFLGEHEAGERYQVSRPVVREAFRTLEAQGYITIRHGQRARVLPPGGKILDRFFSRVLANDVESWRQLMDVRTSLERLSARAAAQNRSPADIRQMRRIVSAMANTIHDPDAYNEQDVGFHIALAAATGNPYLRYLIESVRRSLVEVLRALRASLPLSVIPHVQASHVRVIDAVEAGDAVASEDAMIAHFEIVRRNMAELKPEPDV